MRIALSGLDIFQRFIIHLGNAEKHFCNSNLRNSGDHLEFDLNMASLQLFETNTLTAFFSYETITTLWIGMFTLKCSKSRIFYAHIFLIFLPVIFNAVFLQTFGFKMELSAGYAASYRCFHFVICSFFESVQLQLGHSRKSHVIFWHLTFEHFLTISHFLEVQPACQ